MNRKVGGIGEWERVLETRRAPQHRGWSKRGCTLRLFHVGQQNRRLCASM